MSEPDDLPDDRTLATGSGAGRTARVLQAGDIIGGHYTIQGLIGRGGMGLVYEATHTSIDRRVAIKVLAADQVDQELWERFQNEGRAIARLDHPNIVKVYDLGTDGPSCLYYVMDLLAGISLAERIKKKQGLALPETISILDQLCAGLGYAHSKGLVHRDVKPSNIILCPTADRDKPRVKIIDFGLVKLINDDNRMQQWQTAGDQVFGSPIYMSPEQCTGGKIDARTDVYSLGVTLYECLTGVPPFMGKNSLETASMHQNQRPPSLADERPEKKFPKNVEDLVARMLEKFPAQRQQSMEQVAKDLARIKEGKSIRRAPIFTNGPLYETDAKAEIVHRETSKRRGAPFQWLAVVAVITLLGVGGLVWYRQKTTDASDKQAKIMVGETKVPELITGQQETADMQEARELYSRCPPISKGVTTVDGLPKRVFEFPSIAIGTIYWGQRREYKYPARGTVILPADVPLSLELKRPVSKYVFFYPSILEKIGRQDITELRIEDSSSLFEESTMMFEVPPALIKIIATWKNLHLLQMLNYRLTDEAVRAMQPLSAIDDLNLRDCEVDGKALSQLSWLNKLRVLDVRDSKNVDNIVMALKDAPRLLNLNLDRTAPSKAALQVLSTCKKLAVLSLSESEIDDEKLDIVSRISSLNHLNLKRCIFTARGLPKLARMKNLKSLRIDFVGLDTASVDKLRKALPGCKIWANNVEPGFKMER